MDIFSHFLWTYAVFFKFKKYRLLTAIFGILPDILSFGPFFIYGLITRNFTSGKPELSSIPDYVFTAYNFTHSLVIFLIIVGILYYITRQIPIYTGGWLLHILIDIPSHSREFFPSPFLYPISSFNVNGISWGNPKFLIVNYSLLLIVYLYLGYTTFV